MKDIFLKVTVIILKSYMSLIMIYHFCQKEWRFIKLKNLYQTCMANRICYSCKKINSYRLALRNQRFLFRVRLLAICRGEVSTAIAHLMPKCLQSRWNCRWIYRNSLLLPLLFCELRMFVEKKLIKKVLNHGLALEKVHRVIQFNQKIWLKQNIDINTELRKNAKNDPKKDFLSW